MHKDRTSAAGGDEVLFQSQSVKRQEQQESISGTAGSAAQAAPWPYRRPHLDQLNEIGDGIVDVPHQNALSLLRRAAPLANQRRE